MKQPSYLKSFNDKAVALERCRLRNQANRVLEWRWAVVRGPDEEETWCVVDLDTAIELGGGYTLVR